MITTGLSWHTKPVSGADRKLGNLAAVSLNFARLPCQTPITVPAHQILRNWQKDPYCAGQSSAIVVLRAYKVFAGALA
jgi:hypothetical protein